jgi:hypothetical protein
MRAMSACHSRTRAVPSRGAATRPRAMAKGATAALRLPQLPLQSISGASIATWPKRYSTSQPARVVGPTTTTLLVLEVAPPRPSIC